MHRLLIVLLFFGIQVVPGVIFRKHGLPAIANAATPKEQTVIFNTKTKKFHSPSCKWAVKCTKSCISISLSEALKRGGVACKVCGGR